MGMSQDAHPRPWRGACSRIRATLATARRPGVGPENQFDKRRRWRFDYAHIATRIAVESMAACGVSGRHNQGNGYL